jgi:hypothetical protein
MAANPALWADVQRDLEAARKNAADLLARAEALEQRGAELPLDLRFDREIAIGAMLHNCFGAMESALERLIEAVDGSLPTGRNYHAELIRRAAAPVPEVRPAVISMALAGDLQQLRQYRHAFRHAYGDYDYARAAENVPIAARAVPGLATEIEEFARGMALI